MLKTYNRSNWKILVPLVALALCGIFWLPYHVPARPSFSDSYLFGFNNQVAWLAFLALLVSFALLGHSILSVQDDDRKLSRRTLYLAIAGTFLASCVMFFVTRPLSGYSESPLFTDRIRLMLAGRIPYRDLEFPYGAGTLYAPYFFARFLHLKVTDAYGLVYILANSLGTWLLWLCVNWLDGSLRAKRAIFPFFWAVALINTTNFGLNYSLLRFDLPIFAILVVYRSALPGAANDRWPFLWSVLGYFVILLLSPELAVAFALSSLMYLPLAGLVDSRSRVLTYLFTAALILGISGVAFHLGVFTTLLAFRSGGLNFPVVPAMNVWLLLVPACVVAAAAGTLLRTPGKRGTALPLLCLALFASGGAFGRCDPGHTLLNGLSLVLGGTLILTDMRLPWPAFSLVLWYFYVLPIVPAIPDIARSFGRMAIPSVIALERGNSPTRFDLWLSRHLRAKYGVEQGEESLQLYRDAARGQRALNFAQLFGQNPGTIFEVPFGFYVEPYGRYEAPALDPGYFYSLVNVGTPEQVVQKTEELRQHPERPLLLAPGAENSCSQNPGDERVNISRLFQFPYHAMAVHPQSVAEPFCNYIQAHYQRATMADKAHFNYALWLPVHPSSNASIH